MSIVVKWHMRSALASVLLTSILIAAASGVDEPTRLVQAKEILNKIRYGEPVEYDHIIIKGDLRLDQLGLTVRYINRTEQELKLGLPENMISVPSSIRVNDSRIDGAVYFNNAIFLGAVDFSRSQFNDEAYFGTSQFDGYANFGFSRFLSEASFEDSQFKSYVNFWFSKFGGDAVFKGCRFDRIVSFRESQFESYANFWRSQFNRDVIFRNARFNEDASFEDTQFKGHADFRYSQFDGGAYLMHSCFNNVTDFSEAYFNGAASFKDSLFNDDAHFDNSQFENNADFRNSQFSDHADFNCSCFNRSADFTLSRFDKTLDYTGTEYKNLNLNWFSVRNHYGFSSDRYGYLSLVKHFKDVEDYESADDCYYHYRIWRLRYDDQSWSKGLIDFVFLISCGYGVKPLHTIFLSFILILLFGLIYRRNEIVQQQGLQSISYRDAIFFSASIFFTLPPVPGWRYSERWRYLIIFEDILGWVLMTLFVVTMSHVMLR